MGLRHDGGDAETGAGLEVGGGLAWSDPSSGVSADLRARTLVAHAESGYREWGASGTLRIVPGARGRGLSLSLAPAFGRDSGGADRLLAARDANELVPVGGGGTDPGTRFHAELGYGWPALGDRFTGTPYAGFDGSDTGRRYRLGLRLTRPSGSGSGYRAGAFELSLEANRRVTVNHDAPERGIEFRLATGGRVGPGAFRFSLEANRRKAAGADPDHGIGLRLTIRF